VEDIVALIDARDERAKKIDAENAIAYLTQGGQTAGHRELWRLLRSLFNESSDSAEYTDETSPAAG
jgi:hypothetical protein